MTKWWAALIGLASLAACLPAAADPPAQYRRRSPHLPSASLTSSSATSPGAAATLPSAAADLCIRPPQSIGRRGALTIEQWADRDGRVLVKSDLGGFRSTSATTPDGSWSTNASGQVLLEQPNGYELSRRYAALAFGDALLGRAGARRSSHWPAAPTTARADQFAVVQATFGDADTFDALIDPATGALCCYLITTKGA